MKNKLFIFLVIIALLFSARNYFSSQFSYTHDGENHLARFANYKLAIREGQFPPRFAPKLLNNYGYPVFNYNYPLANIISVPFSVLKINYEIIFKTIVLGSLAFGVRAVYLWVKRYDQSKLYQFLAICFYLFSPYLANIIYFRGNIGELMAMSILPWLFLYTEKLVDDFNNLQKKSQKFFLIKFSLLWSIFFLAHNIFALLGTALVIGFYLSLAIVKKSNSYATFIASIFIGILSTLWFWLPAIVEKNLIVLDDSNLSSQYAQHFPTLNQLFLSPLEYGFSRMSSVDDFSFSLGLTGVALLILMSLFHVKKLLNHEKLEVNYSIYSLLSLLLVFFQLSMSLIIWYFIFIGNYVQFPWRLTMLFTITMIPILIWSLQNLTKFWKAILIFILIFQINSQLNLKSADYFHKQNQDYEAFSQTTSTQNENLPKTFHYENLYENIGEWQPSPIIHQGNANIAFNLDNGDFWSGSKRQYSIQVMERSTIIEPTAFFPGWESKDILSKKKINYIDNDEVRGRIAYQLDPGSYVIRSSFTQKTWPRMIGNLISGLILLSLALYSLGLLLLDYKSNKNANKK